jgi:hypothetical protein
MTDFERALAFVLMWEGGYTNDPDDPGGETNFGISKRAYPRENIKAMTRERAAELYKRDYWIPAGCEGKPYPLALAIFDTAVNCGTVSAKSWAKDFDEDPLALVARRVLYYFRIVKKTPSSSKFLKGWLNRVAGLVTVVLKEK